MFTYASILATVTGARSGSSSTTTLPIVVTSSICGSTVVSKPAPVTSFGGAGARESIAWEVSITSSLVAPLNPTTASAFSLMPMLPLPTFSLGVTTNVQMSPAPERSLIAALATVKSPISRPVMLSLKRSV